MMTRSTISPGNCPGGAGSSSAANSAFAAGFADAVAALAARLDSPILAEPLSNLRFGAHDRSRLLVRYNLWLGDSPAEGEDRPEWVLRFGAWPVTRNLQDYAAAAAEQIVVDPWPRWSDPAHRVTRMLRADPTALCQALLAQRLAPAPPVWRARLAVRERGAQDATTGHFIDRLVDVLPDGHAVFVGNSLAIRQLDSYAGSGSKTLRFFGNRGASGIDGNVSTALGIAAAAGPVVVLVGDLTLPARPWRPGAGRRPRCGHCRGQQRWRAAFSTTCRSRCCPSSSAAGEPRRTSISPPPRTPSGCASRPAIPPPASPPPSWLQSRTADRTSSNTAWRTDHRVRQGCHRRCVRRPA